MRKMCHKIRNGQNAPHESPHFTKKKFKVLLDLQFKPFKSETILPKQFVSK